MTSVLEASSPQADISDEEEDDDDDGKQKKSKSKEKKSKSKEKKSKGKENSDGKGRPYIDEIFEDVKNLKDFPEKDCIGPYRTCKDFQSYYSTSVDPATGNFIQKFIPSRETECMKVEACSLDSIARNTEKKCTGDGLEGLCAICTDFSCRAVGEPTICQLSLPIDDEPSTKKICSSFHGNINARGDCVFPKKLLLSSCFDNQTIWATKMERSISYCFNSTILDMSSCVTAKGDWEATVSRCKFDFGYTKCNEARLTYVPGYRFMPGWLSNKEQCKAAGKVCILNNGNYSVAPSVCAKARIQRAGYCNDFEYYNSDGGLCTVVPTSQKVCPSTATGLCIVNKVNGTCPQSSSWIRRAILPRECSDKGKYCANPDGSTSLLSAMNCVDCGGIIGNAYTWKKGRVLVGSLMRKLEWKKLEWVQRNRMASNVVSIKVLNSLFETAAARSVGAQLVGKFQPFLNTYLSVFKMIACDCVENREDCFGNIIKTPTAMCKKDPTKFGKCGNLFLNPKAFNGQKPISVKEVQVSVGNFLGFC